MRSTIFRVTLRRRQVLDVLERPAVLSRRFILRQMSISVIAFVVSVFVLRFAVRPHRVLFFALGDWGCDAGAAPKSVGKAIGNW